MLFESPVVTKREIAHAYTSKSKPDSAMRTLRSNHAVSAGLEAPVRSSRGHLGGSLHLYCAINRDAARAARLKDLDLAHELASRAGRIERSPVMRRLIARVAAVAADTSYAALAAALSQPECAADVALISRRIQTVRRELQGLGQTTLMHGRVTKLQSPSAVLLLDEGQVSVPMQMLHDRGVPESEGAAVTAWWEYDQGDLRLSIEPAVEIPGDPEGPVDAAPQDLYGTRWGEILGDDGVAYAVARLANPRHSIRRPRVPITIED